MFFPGVKISDSYFPIVSLCLSSGSDIVSLGIASGKHVMKDASTNTVIGSGRLNGSPFSPIGSKSLQVTFLCKKAPRF